MTNKYFVEFESGCMRVGLFLYAQSPEQITDMMSDYVILTIEPAA